MSWSIGYDSTWKRDIGYGVPAFCDHPGCGKKIDRGLAFVCADSQPYGGDGCGLYFCAEHLTASTKSLLSCCERCGEGKEPFTPTADHPEWIHHKLTDESWKKWREENPEEVVLLTTIQRAAEAGSALPIPQACYPCKICRTEVSWPADDLFWSEKLREWFCCECWDNEEHGEPGTSLKDELKRQNEVSPSSRSQDWRSISDDLAAALESLDTLYRSEQDPEAPMTRPEWLHHPWQRYHRAVADSCNEKCDGRCDAATTHDTEKALNYYRSGLEQVRPEYVPARVMLKQRVMGDGIFRSTFAEPGEHDCRSNQWGAISVVATNGKDLGVKPAEFDVIEWRLNERAEP